MTTTDIKWFQDKRNLQLEKFNRLIKTDATFDRIEHCYSVLIKLQHQLRLVEDVFVTEKITQGWKES